jgi:cytoskeletal protein RodZ
MDTYSLGRYLRETRETKERTLEEAVAALKIRRHILERFEQGDFSTGELSPVQIRFIRNYARFLELDQDLIVQYYEAAISDGKRRKPKRKKRKEARSAPGVPVAPRSITDTPPSLPRVTLGEQRDTAEQQWSRLFNALIMVLVGGAALAVIVFVGVQLFRQPEDTVEPERRAILELSPTCRCCSTTTPARVSW